MDQHCGHLIRGKMRQPPLNAAGPIAAGRLPPFPVRRRIFKMNIRRPIVDQVFMPGLRMGPLRSIHLR